MLQQKVYSCLKGNFWRSFNYSRTFATPAKREHAQESKQVSESSRTKISRETKQISNKPFMKNIFAGVYEPESLKYPEILSKRELEELDDLVLKTKSFFDNKDKEVSVNSPDILTELKKLGLVGSSVEEEFGGENFKTTKVLRLLEEIPDENIHSYLYTHNNLATKCLNGFGSDELKEKYLPTLTSGKSFAGFCIHEDKSGSDLNLIQTYASISGDKSSYVLNGEKTWVVNADKADFFVLFAKTTPTYGHDLQEKISAFFVEKSSGGITIGDPYKTFGFQDLPVYSVKFNDTKIPVSNVIGDLGSGHQIAIHALYGDMFLKGSIWTNILKKLSKRLVDHCIKRELFDQSLKDFGLIQEKLATMAMNIYAIESMTYMTAGVVDSFVQPDILCESAAIKIYGSEKLWSSVKDALQIMGSSACKMEDEIPNVLMNASTNSLTTVTNEILRLYIAYNCVNHAGLILQESIRKRRNGFNNVKFLLRNGWDQITNKKGNLHLYDHVHPELSFCGDELQQRITILKDLVITVWSTRTSHFTDNQFMAKRLADVAINFYVLNATMARASRSKAIGLKNCDQEIILAKKLIETLISSIDKDLAEIERSYHMFGDLVYGKIADTVIEGGGYSIEHPLTRNW